MCKKCGFSPDCPSSSWSLKSFYHFLRTILFGVLIVILPSAEANKNTFEKVFTLKGGLVDAVNEDIKGLDYYEQFELDYGSSDKERKAGALRGFLKTGALTALPESDPFKKWLNKHLEKGTKEFKGRIKPFYAADFGTKKDLNGENPKIFIVQRMLKQNSDGTNIECSKEYDIETREIWQPWLKSKCNFVVRYIVPNRVNIVKILESKGQYKSSVIVDKDKKGSLELKQKMIFHPRLVDRLKGKKDIVLYRKLDSKALENAPIIKTFSQTKTDKK